MPMRVRMRSRRLAEVEASRAGAETTAEILRAEDETSRAEDEGGVIGMSGVGLESPEVVVEAEDGVEAEVVGAGA